MKGYILLEIMVSLAIIAIVFVSLFRMQSGTIGLAATGQFKSIAPILAQLKLSEIEADLANTQEMADEDKGNFEGQYEGYAWEYSITSATVEDNGEGLDFIHEDRIEDLKKIDLVIKGNQDNKTFGLTTWRIFNDHPADQ